MPMTNFEKITQSPEALAAAAMSEEDLGCCAICACNKAGMCSNETVCEIAMLAWLNSPAEGGADE